MAWIPNSLNNAFMCKWNFKVIYEQYNYYNITNDISCYDHCECPFNNAVDNCGIKVEMWLDVSLLL